jgi:hypothetical protein
VLDRFTLTIDLGNDAMQSHTDIADALRNVIAALYRGQTQGKVRDANGNTVGDYVTTEEGMSDA